MYKLYVFKDQKTNEAIYAVTNILGKAITYHNIKLHGRIHMYTLRYENEVTVITYKLGNWDTRSYTIEEYTIKEGIL